MKALRAMRAISFAVLIAMALPAVAQSAPPSQSQILLPANLGKIVPSSVFFRGQTATTQLRNSGGVRFANDAVMFAVLVDNSGYSTGIQQKYQAYFITEVPLEIEGHRLAPGAYGAGILKMHGELHFVVDDLGAHDLFHAVAKHDAALHRPVPLQVMAGGSAGSYRLYLGRNYVEFRQEK
ncbi:MAG: hypothetical protein ACRD3F_03910 [Acidobacteriaceae bacterium]